VTPHRITLVTIAVEPHTTVTGWKWTVDGPAGTDHGIAPTEGEAWGVARAAAVAVMGRLEVPGGGEQLRRALAGEGT
jgi:hypothetical protein